MKTIVRSLSCLTFLGVIPFIGPLARGQENSSTNTQDGDKMVATKVVVRKTTTTTSPVVAPAP